MEGVRVPIDAAFEVAGERLFLPCDPDGSFEETAGCRCFVEFADAGEELGSEGDERSPEVRREDLDIDERFLDEREGFLLVGKVPTDDDRNIIGDSGVTVGGGVDLGQQSEADLRRRGVPEDLIDKLRPFLGLKREAAQRFLRENPLILTEDQARTLTDRVRGGIALEVARNFNRNSELRFEDLPPKVQTVIASVATQFGPNLGRSNATPRFWRFVTAGDWQRALEELRDFGDRFQDRRDEEADKLLEAFPDLDDPGKISERERP